MSTFTIVNDETLMVAISAARKKLVLVAPGISKIVAEALGKRFKELGRLSITVILDVDPEVCRLGYGEIAGLQKIKALADENLLELRHQPGVRLGILISDTETLIYAPTPLLVEAGSRQPEKPNAIVIRDAPLAQVERAMAVDENSLPSDAEIGNHVVAAKQIAEVEKDLKENPPKEFNIARAERVFNSRIQYVEFKVENYKLSSKVAPIPPDLMGLADSADLLDRWRNSFRMFDAKNPFRVKVSERDEDGLAMKNPDGSPKLVEYSEKHLDKEKAQIVRDYLFVVPNFDTVILRARRTEFDARIEQFRTRLADFKAAAEAQLTDEMKRSIQNLVDYLMPRAAAKSLARYRKASLNAQVEGDELKAMLAADLADAFGKVDTVFAPSLTVRFKDVTYESIHDGKFREALDKVMPARTVEKLFREYDAAPEQRR